MLQHKDEFHGSDLEKIEAIYHIPKEEIVCFGANVNPLGISERMQKALGKHADVITRYPDRDYKELRSCIAEYTGTRPENVLVGSGSTELISLFIRTQQPRKALILGPTYSEYEREVALAGGSVSYYPLREQDCFSLAPEEFIKSLDPSVDLLILCNPNNPTSTAITQIGMRTILDACLLCGITVMIDETYAEFAPDVSSVTAIPLAEEYPNLIILRGTSKFFAAPGLRLGYAVAGNGKMREEINSLKNPWTVNSLADLAGCVMFQDQEYIKKTRGLICGERERMYRILSEWDTVTVYEPSANFILMKILKENVNAGILFDHCIRKGMMIRNCSSFPYLDGSFVRFCIMLPEQNDRLLESFAELLRPF